MPALLQKLLANRETRPQSLVGVLEFGRLTEESEERETEDGEARVTEEA